MAWPGTAEEGDTVSTRPAMVMRKVAVSPPEVIDTRFVPGFVACEMVSLTVPLVASVRRSWSG